MNKRIIELAKQAGYTPLVPRTFADDLQEIFLQKFAQLIARDCGTIYEKIDNGCKHLGTDDYLEALCKHFGVKHFGVEE